MKFNKLKYIICIVIVLLLTGISIVPFCDTSNDTMSEGQSKFDPSTSENKSEQVGETERTFSNSFDLFTFANDIIINGDGYDIDNYTTIDAVASGIPATINMYVNYKKNKDVKLETLIFSSKEFSFANSKNYAYLEDEIAQNTCTKKLVSRQDNFKDNVFDFSQSKIYEKKYPEEYVEKYHRLLEVMPFTVNKSTASQTYFRSDSNYYYFEFNLKNQGIDPMFFECFTAGLNADYYKLKFMSIEGVCNKKTGGFEQVTIKTGIKIPINKFGINITIDGVMTSVLKVKKMNTPVTISYPKEMIGLEIKN